MSGVNDYLDHDGFTHAHPIPHQQRPQQKNIDAEVVQAATKWKRIALAQFGMELGEGLLTDIRAVRKDYFLDHDHNAYVDQIGGGISQSRTFMYLVNKAHLGKVSVTVWPGIFKIFVCQRGILVLK